MGWWKKYIYIYIDRGLLFLLSLYLCATRSTYCMVHLCLLPDYFPHPWQSMVWLTVGKDPEITVRSDEGGQRTAGHLYGLSPVVGTIISNFLEEIRHVTLLCVHTNWLTLLLPLPAPTEKKQAALDMIPFHTQASHRAMTGGECTTRRSTKKKKKTVGNGTSPPPLFTTTV